MNVLFIGDVVGAPGVDLVVARLPELRKRHAVDVVVANAENAGPDGLGLTTAALERLLAGGVDVITGGNHSWQGDRAPLDHPRVLRPHNVAGDAPGTGVLTLDVGTTPLTVLNLAGADALDNEPTAPAVARPAYAAFRSAPLVGTVLVDIHANHVFEKQVFAHAVDGRAAAVLGTHTHEPTLDVHHLPGGTVLVADVGMTGLQGGVMGFEPEGFVAALDGRTPWDSAQAPLRVGSPVLGAILMQTDGSVTRWAIRIR